MTPLAHLLAAGGSFQVIVILVMMVIYALNYVLAGGKKAPGRKPNGPAPQPAPRSREQLNAELSDFLRRAAEKRAAGGPPPVAQPVPVAAPPRRRKKQANVAPPPKVEEPITSRRMVSRVDTRQFQQRADQLMSLDKTDEIGTQVQHKFDHQVGQLSKQADPGAPPAPAPGTSAAESPMAGLTPAAAIRALLENPQSLGGAVILNEVLTRPVHRW